MPNTNSLFLATFIDSQTRRFITQYKWSLDTKLFRVCKHWLESQESTQLF